MDDNFLYQLQEEPDAEFAKDLHRKLMNLHLEPKGKRNLNVWNMISHKKLVQVSALVIISIIAIMAISPARAFVSALITDIAGQVFDVIDDYPGDNYEGGEEIIEPKLMSLHDGLAAFPYSVELPKNIPSDFNLNESNVCVYLANETGLNANTIEFEWHSNTLQDSIFLRVTDRDWHEIVAPNAVTEITINEDYPAALIQGGWDIDQKMWRNDLGVRIRWSIDNLFYELMGTNQEQLFEIALSIVQ